MTKTFAIVCVLLVPFFSQAKTTVSNEYSFPVVVLEELETALQKAADRDAKEHRSTIASASLAMA